MADKMKPTPPYNNVEPFDAQHGLRQKEIREELSLWSQGEEFRAQARKEVAATLENHDELMKLSKRLFENGGFLNSFKDQTQNEIISHKKNTLWERWGKWGWLAAGALIYWLFEHVPGYIKAILNRSPE